MSELRDLPQSYLLGGRPVKIVETPDGGMQALGYDKQTGQLVSNIDFLFAIFGQTADVEKITEREFDRVVEQLRSDREKGANG